ncbi:MAG: hypothetical protein CL910_08490 [Deltaproteobacteria bacterium]|jgi:hypothetical protein|nr:hypothetical protein [Deltaproteobacteria bacterium]
MSTPSPDLPPPSEVRRRVLEDHVRVRLALQELRSSAEWARTGVSDRGPNLRQEAGRFTDFFFQHLEMEEEILLPTLRGVDAWGDARAERVLEEHLEQRQMLTELLEDLDRTPERLTRHARHVLWLADAIEADMLHEEESVLSEKLLHDDLVNVDSMGG